MTQDQQFVFGPFSLDSVGSALYADGARIALRGKAFHLLCFLAQHPNQVISKRELLRHVWANAWVHDAALKVTLGEVRKALGDSPATPIYIATVGRDGYRFIAPVRIVGSDGSESASLQSFVGRQAELGALRRHLELAHGGRRQLVFLTGESGIGKTTLVETFVRTALAEGVVVAQGQCIEQYGAGEAYLPILDMLDRLCKLADGAAAIAALRRLAPSWLLSLPGLVSADESAELARQNLGVTPERRLREIAAFLEEIAKSRTVLLVVEDLHWLDPSTLALIAYLARRREAARLMLIGTYREDEVEQFNHPLKDLKTELQLHNQCAHVHLNLLPQSAVGEYLAARFETDAVAQPVVAAIYRRSEGNPLFMVNVTDYLVDRDAIVRENGAVKLLDPSELGNVPETIRDLIDRQVNALAPADQQLLETASIAGTTFSVATIARVLARTREQAESQYRDLAKRGQFLQYAGLRTRPNGRGTPRYSFVHALYQNVIYQRVDEARRRRLHQAIGASTEAAYAGATDQVAAELALHFERGGDYAQAVRYLLTSAQRAVQRNTYQEAIGYCHSGLARLASLANSSERDELEMSFHLLSGVALASSQGYASAQGQVAFAKARRLSARVTTEFLRFQTLAGLWSYHLLRGQLAESLKIAREMLSIAQRTGDWSFMLNGHMAAGLSHFYIADLTTAHDHLRSAVSQYDIERFLTTVSAYSWDPGIVTACYDAMTLQLLGYPAQAERQADKARELAQVLTSPFHPALTNGILATYYTYRGDVEATLAAAENAIAISTENGFFHWLACGTIHKGWAMARQGRPHEGMSLLVQGIADWQSTGAEMVIPTFRLLQAEAHLTVGDGHKAMKLVEQAFALSQKNHESYYDAELYRLRGEIRLGAKRLGANLAHRREAEADFQRAIRTAKKHKARSLELRATTSLCRLWQKTGKEKEAKRTLAKIYGWFTEGFDAPDLRQAKELLDQLS